MNFSEAMHKLKSGSRVTRESLKRELFFLLTHEGIKTFKPVIYPYIYDEDIMISEEWLVDDDIETYEFSEIIPLLQKGSIAKQEYWVDKHIYYDKSSKNLLVKSMGLFPYIPEFECFVANDWIELL